MFRSLLTISLIFPYAVWATTDITTKNIMRQVDFLQHRHEVLAQNVANVSTPGYTTQELEAPELVPKSKAKLAMVRMQITNSKHLRPRKKDDGRYTRYSDKSSAYKPNGNNVDLKQQVLKMASNKDEVSQHLKNYRTSMNLLLQVASGSTQ